MGCVEVGEEVGEEGVRWGLGGCVERLGGR